jgi:DNA-binding HxlR family transcriptional regulator
MTDAQRRLETVAAKWALPTVVALADGSLRFGELRRRVTGISQKMLTQTLRALEREGVVTRTVHAEVPPRVEYALTADGHAAGAAVAALVAWSERAPG